MATEIVQRETVEAQWRRALQRALDESLDVLICGATGEAFVESSSRPGLLHAVSATSCTCEAGRFGVPCKHAACFRAAMGLLVLPEFDVEIDDVVDRSPAPCPSCTHGRIEEWGVSGPIGCKPCPVCDGSGLAQDRRLAGWPAVMPTAAA